MQHAAQNLTWDWALLYRRNTNTKVAEKRKSSTVIEETVESGPTCELAAKWPCSKLPVDEEKIAIVVDALGGIPARMRRTKLKYLCQKYAVILQSMVFLPMDDALLC